MCNYICQNPHWSPCVQYIYCISPYPPTSYYYKDRNQVGLAWSVLQKSILAVCENSVLLIILCNACCSSLTSINHILKMHKLCMHVPLIENETWSHNIFVGTAPNYICGEKKKLGQHLIYLNCLLKQYSSWKSKNRSQHYDLPAIHTHHCSKTFQMDELGTKLHIFRYKD